jgi:hypothetical protein
MRIKERNRALLHCSIDKLRKLKTSGEKCFVAAFDEGLYKIKEKISLLRLN